MKDDNYAALRGPYGADSPFITVKVVRKDLAALLAERDELQAEVERLRGQVPQWVETSDRIPPEDHALLFIRGVMFVGRKRYGNLGEPSQDKHAYRASCCGRLVESVSHWMPLPQPPAR